MSNWMLKELQDNKSPCQAL
uniref:Uncharacterized protein n=1 Tax=Megaselia scalaris TaxID=36166 RepID=T1GGF1_MEGSC